MKNYYVTLITLLFITFSTVSVNAQVFGCTDPLSTNYAPDATDNDGSCMYDAATVSPEYSVTLSDDVNETSGLILWGDYVYTHNDSNDITLYGLNTITGDIESTDDFSDAVNTDWEDIAQDENYIYIGDFGNNANGNRTDLSILKISKESITNDNPVIEYINFSYSNQTNFDATGANSTDFDCEAIIVGENNIYLFTKQWVSQETSVYALPKTAGDHTAQLQTSYDVDGLITGATYIENKKLVVLSGYSAVLQPFFYLLYDYTDTDFFSGNKRKITMSAPFHQVEGIATQDGSHYFVSNESFEQPPVPEIPQKLHYFDLSSYLEDYLLKEEVFTKSDVVVYPNPVNDVFYIQLLGELSEETDYTIIDVTGKTVDSGVLTLETNKVDISKLEAGMYMVRIKNKLIKSFSVIKTK
ncbi:MAG: hypothetical protein BM557_01600 [Flavobacterium sp. MedPE-SWcel]|uniref:T9SS type A sorting domain-containing protein n=1 Tax=uncultured Flavobacterium sp. TaxID=165435 RepID=UPI00091C0520|nr:T9SS type A sorting domain-containing protein [uncultured Flavobacterium sp.]OIQ22099.1 MAG: hypothetical protein BM557_01600 [Flavobacterium sp. MedPE-SWcel]